MLRSLKALSFAYWAPLSAPLLALLLTLAPAVLAAPGQSISVSLGEVQVAGACPRVATQQQKQQGVSWGVAKASLDARVLPDRAMNDRKTLHDLRDCMQAAKKVVGTERLGLAGGDAEAALLTAANQCLAGQPTDLRVTVIVLRRGPVVCQ